MARPILRVLLAMMLVGAGARVPVFAADATTVFRTPPVDAGTLERARGGFLGPNGLVASFGFDRTTAIDGRVVLAQTVRVADLARMSAAESGALRSVLAGAGAVVQNTESGRTIRSTTTIDVTSTTLGLFQRANASRSLDQALIAPLVRP